HEIIKKMSEERRPGIIHHPMNHHLAIRPVDSIGFILSADIFVMGKLCFFREFLHAGWWPVAFVDHSLDIFECIVPFVRASMEVPVLIDRPQLFGRNKFLKAFHRRNRFVISFFSRRSSCWSIVVAEPVIRWPPHVRTRHVNTAPGAIHMRNGIYYGVLPMLFLKNLVVIV